MEIDGDVGDDDHKLLDDGDVEIEMEIVANIELDSRGFLQRMVETR